MEFSLYPWDVDINLENQLRVISKPCDYHILNFLNCSHLSGYKELVLANFSPRVNLTANGQHNGSTL